MKEKIIYMDEEKISFQKENKNKYKSTKVHICEWCNHPYKAVKLEKCSGKDCGLLLCKKCKTMINDFPFCNECVADIVRHKTLLIITKGKVGESEE